MAAEKGAFLGSEDELIERIGVSRPTLRQAARIAENDRLVEIRRGTKGGLYAARPEAADAIRQLARYLRLRGATIGDVRMVNRLVSEEAAELAARCADEDLRARLADLMATIEEADDPRAVIRLENKLAALIAEMSGNPAIELVMAIGYTFGMAEQGLQLFGEADQRRQLRALQTELCRAILNRDPEIARVMMRRRGSLIGEWIDAGARA